MGTLYHKLVAFIPPAKDEWDFCRRVLKLSAANQFKGEVIGIKEGMTNTEVMIKTIGGDKLSAMVTNKSIKNLALQIGDKVIAMIKASQIIISA
ncbi:TOBE domain-containing protein [Helicobacter suis]|uniref:TOBE domain-containing protein n=1 Tax=Helicobacter suis TaxID=104628 RepID=UPI0013D1F830